VLVRTVKDKHGQLPIHAAAQHNPSAAVVEYLIHAGGPSSTQVAVPTSLGAMQPIHLAAACNGSLEVVRAIAAATGDATRSPGEERLALAAAPITTAEAIAQIAARTNPNEAVVEFLVRHFGWRLFGGQEHSSEHGGELDWAAANAGTPLYRKGAKGVWRWMQRHDAAVA
jgi:ankyrin repeat protein